MFYVVANMVWLKVVNNNIDEYLDKDNVSRELISYEGKKTNLEYYIITCNYKGVEKKEFGMKKSKNRSKNLRND